MNSGICIRVVSIGPGLPRTLYGTCTHVDFKGGFCAPSGQCCSCRWVFRLEMPETARIALVDRLATVEANLSTGTSERLQLGALVAAFNDARRIMVTAA